MTGHVVLLDIRDMGCFSVKEYASKALRVCNRLGECLDKFRMSVGREFIIPAGVKMGNRSEDSRLHSGLGGADWLLSQH